MKVALERFLQIECREAKTSSVTKPITTVASSAMNQSVPSKYIHIHVTGIKHVKSGGAGFVFVLDEKVMGVFSANELSNEVRQNQSEGRCFSQMNGAKF